MVYFSMFARFNFFVFENSSACWDHVKPVIMKNAFTWHNGRDTSINSVFKKENPPDGIVTASWNANNNNNNNNKQQQVNHIIHQRRLCYLYLFRFFRGFIRENHYPTVSNKSLASRMESKWIHRHGPIRYRVVISSAQFLRGVSISLI